MRRKELLLDIKLLVRRVHHRYHREGDMKKVHMEKLLDELLLHTADLLLLMIQNLY